MYAFRKEASKNDLLNRIHYLLASIKSYLYRFSFPNGNLYSVLNSIESNLDRLEDVDEATAGSYIVNALNYLENLNNKYMWLHG